jgi:gluconolactonase
VYFESFSEWSRSAEQRDFDLGHSIAILEANKNMFRMRRCFVLLVITFSQVVTAQQPGGEPRRFPQPQGAKEVPMAEIPGVIATGSPWKLVWQGPDNADGIVGTDDGELLFAQEQPNHVGKLDKNDRFSVYLKDTHGAGALAIDSKGRVLAAERTCTDPGQQPAKCTEPTAIGVLAPERKVLASSFEGSGIGRPNDLIVDKKGGVYFNSPEGLFYMSPSGQVAKFGENVRTNGIMLSRDEKTFYATNGGTLVAFDVQPDGSLKNQREFAKLEAGGMGDGMAIDSEGRLYVSSGPGIQVVSPKGEYLGLIPSPRPVISVAFSGPDKKILYMVGAGALGPDGKEFRTPEGVRNNAKSIYKVAMVAQGFQGRAK